MPIISSRLLSADRSRTIAPFPAKLAVNDRPVNESSIRRNIRPLLLMFLIVIIAAPPLTFAEILAHEGGHGLLTVPAIILNRQIPKVPNEETSWAGNSEWNPFSNFPEAIYFFFLSFPLGVVANVILSYLSYRNAKLYRFSSRKRRIALLAVFLSFCIMNFNGVLTNFFGQDFAFIWKGIGFPYNADWFRYLTAIATYVVLPLFLGIRKGGFDLDKMLTVSAGTYTGSMLAKIFIFDPLQGMLIANFWWMLIAGLPAFIITLVALGRRRGRWSGME